MKRIFITITAIAVYTIANAQFTNTKWKATLQLNSPTDVVLDFKTDTVTAITTEDNNTLEVMVYKVEDTVLTLQKVTGQSECGGDIIGKYKFVKKDDNDFMLTLISDDCYDRSGVLDNSSWTKENE